MTQDFPLRGNPETQFGSLESFLAQMGALGDESLGRAHNNPSQVIKNNPTPAQPTPKPEPTPKAAQPTPAPTPMIQPPIPTPPAGEEGGFE